VLSDLKPSWMLALDAANKSPKTIISYLDSVKRLEAYLAAEGLPLERPAIRAFLASERVGTSPASAARPSWPPCYLGGSTVWGLSGEGRSVHATASAHRRSAAEGAPDASPSSRQAPIFHGVRLPGAGGPPG